MPNSAGCQAEAGEMEPRHWGNSTRTAQHACVSRPGAGRRPGNRLICRRGSCGQPAQHQACHRPDVHTAAKHHLQALPSSVGLWDSGRFAVVSKLGDAKSNHGCVHLMKDQQQGDESVAVKQMPNWCVLGSLQAEAARVHDIERPWQDIQCLHYLNEVGYPYVCKFRGVYRDDDFTYVVMSRASESDLFTWSSELTVEPGPARAALIQPIACQILDAVKHLHNLSIIHRDLSLENILLHKEGENGQLRVKIADFGAASATRNMQCLMIGKGPYLAPELHRGGECDGFLSDTFAVGVVVYGMALKQLPWASTSPGACKCFQYAEKKGLRPYFAKRQCGGVSVEEALTEPVVEVLKGLLAFSPDSRLVLGESAWAGS
eukprot:CAMPEP_0195074050 /NCGR_PEP_ID=MMETSP0448-20130528/17248_1 /TAXON_ID=66468 /ORGANISM="Heterocapsa triquestra, Strain CCMP 448" /LENGTH=374 /DNA_ID=CAMNT_0040106247 /DNA_START=81 /DNA_END=1201 /DNA_ORIENTATION=-